jgi:hypothetical protein
MKLCKAWPDTPGCSKNFEANLDHTNSVTNLTEEKSIVLPKSVVERAVNRVVTNSMSDILKDAFGPDENVAEDDIEDPKLPDAEIHKTVIKKDQKNDFTIVWAILVAFGIIVFVSIQNMWARIDSMEAWLHGRLASGP